jgi:hypothetical protein
VIKRRFASDCARRGSGAVCVERRLSKVWSTFPLTTWSLLLNIRDRFIMSLPSNIEVSKNLDLWCSTDATEERTKRPVA